MDANASSTRKDLLGLSEGGREGVFGLSSYLYGRNKMEQEVKIGNWVNLTSREKPTRIAGRITGIEESEMFGLKIKVEVIGWLYANEWLISVIQGHKYELADGTEQ